jgi:hypothetical protein
MKQFLMLLTILFIGLKLGGVINWNWLWVLLPITIGLWTFIITLIGIFILGIIFHDDDE